MSKKYCLLVLFSAIYTAVLAQQIRPMPADQIYRELQQLNTLPKVLYFAAHPDDENTGLLSWLVHDQHVETAYLSLTRGDGGQNLLGSEQGAALGLIRTHELLEARKLDGAEQFFTRVIDFGFSKNPEDTFKQWNMDSVTSDAVWVIRKFRPDVIICRFPPTAAAGHGQHSASAMIAEKAFQAAGDPNAFPEQLKYVDVWQPKRLLWNTYRFGSNNTIHPDQFNVTTGQYDPLLGMGYGELAGLSRSLHKSQGAGTPSVAGKKSEYFELVAGAPMNASLWDGLAFGWQDINHTDIAKQIRRILQTFDFNKPDKSIEPLIELRQSIAQIRNKSLRQEKQKQVDAIILSCTGFMGEIITDRPEAIAGDRLPFTLQLIARSNIPIRIESIDWGAAEELVGRILPTDTLLAIERNIQLPRTTPISQPYWMRDTPKSPFQFSVPSDTLIGYPTHSTVPTVQIALSIDGEPFTVALPLSYKKLDPVKGDIVEPLRIVPEVNVKIQQPLFFAKPGTPLRIPVVLSAKATVTSGTLRIHSGDHLLTEQTVKALPLQKDTIVYLSIPLDKIAQITDDQIQAVFEINGQQFSKEQRIIAYNHLPTLQYFLPATARILTEPIQTMATKVGYIEGAGDFIPTFLRLAGVQVDVLSESDMNNPAQLAQYDAIVGGVRVINAEKRMQKWMPKLLDYVKNGGTLLMQYNTTQDMATDQLGPYPFTLSRDRVTEEDATVRFIRPDDRLLHFPNEITPTDFQGWVQERGIYFPKDWDSRYTPLFEMHDTGEAPLQGATLYTPYGKGMYIYTSLVFFRQLPVGHAGAAKLFLNFLSAGK